MPAPFFREDFRVSADVWQVIGVMNATLAEQRFLTREEARAVLRCSESKLYAETRAGRLKVYRFGRLVRIDVADLAEYIRGSYESGMAIGEVA